MHVIPGSYAVVVGVVVVSEVVGVDVCVLEGVVL
jgi:hypothetical protein